MIKYIAVNAEKKAMHKFTKFYEDYTILEGAGIYLGEEIVLVDFDGHNAEEDRIVDAIVSNYPTLEVFTTRGYHLYYKKPKGLKIPNVAGYTTASGLKVDYKNGNQYGIIKIAGVERKRNQEEIDLNNIPELPILLYPYGKDGPQTAGLTEGRKK